MPLFISNFKQESPVLGFVAALLLAIELSLRIWGTHLSLDLLHLRAIPATLQALDPHRHPTFLFIGNSLTRRGVDAEVLKDELKNGGLPDVQIAKLHPDDTNILDWYYLYKYDVRDAGIIPDDVLIGFAEEQLSDTQRVHLSLIASSLGGFRALPEVFRYDARDFESRADYVLAALSMAYANRDRIRTQVFGLIIPYYQTTAQALNTAVRRRQGPSTADASDRYHRLKRFLDFMAGTPARLSFIAIPLPYRYPINPALEPLVLSNGARLIDLHALEGLQESDFLDGYHLSPAGAQRFTRALASRCKPIAMQGMNKISVKQ